jgi:hypothetical protein
MCFRTGFRVTSKTRAPRVGVAAASSTSWEAPCAPTSTPSPSHCTSPSMTCSAPEPDQAALPGCLTLSWSAWRARRYCSATARSAAGCGSPTSGWATCSLTCRPHRPTPAAAPRRPAGRSGHPRPRGAHPQLVRPAAPGRLHPRALLLAVVDPTYEKLKISSPDPVTRTEGALRMNSAGWHERRAL